MKRKNPLLATEKELDQIVPRTTRKRLINEGRFPAPRQVSNQLVGTPWVEVEDWADELPVSTNKSCNPKAHQGDAA